MKCKYDLSEDLAQYANSYLKKNQDEEMERWKNLSQIIQSRYKKMDVFIKSSKKELNLTARS